MSPSLAITAHMRIMEDVPVMIRLAKVCANDVVSFLRSPLVVAPKAIVNRPKATAELHLFLTEPKGDPNSGDSGPRPTPQPYIQGLTQ